MIKTRLQIQGELIKKELTLTNNQHIPHGMFRTGVNIGNVFSH